jgi:dUTP pyrophosphatase
MEVPFLRLRDGAHEPTYATPGSVGFDVWTAEAADIEPGSIALVGTGLVVATPPGWALLVCLRSSTPGRFGVMQPHGIGVIDQDYRGAEDELRLQLLNFTRETVHIPSGCRIAQGVFVRAEQAVWSEHAPDGASRGGFGSTENRPENRR